MNAIIRADQRHLTTSEWLRSFWLFSFSDYFDPDNIQFGALRVFNDDIVQPGNGFPAHPHKEMEIITIVLEGEMTHQDSMGHETVIKAGDVQCMSAGTGVMHSEFNRSGQPVHFYQIWIFPKQPGLKPGYAQKHFDAGDWRNRLLPVASGQALDGAAAFHADATIYRCELEAGRETAHQAAAGRRIFVYLTDGKITINGKTLNPGDQARMAPGEPLMLKAKQSSGFILIDVS